MNERLAKAVTKAMNKKAEAAVDLTNDDLKVFVQADIDNLGKCLAKIQTTYANAALTKLQMELEQKLKNGNLSDLFEIK